MSMSDLNKLAERIQSEFSASQKKLKEFQEQQVTSHKEREDRLEQLEKVFDQLREVWRPRLETLAKEFGDRVKVTPAVTRGLRHAAMEFNTPLAAICLKFSAGADMDVTKVILACDLDILPILMQFEKHAEIAFPLDNVDNDAVAQWLDDRIVQFVKTYLSLHENEYYLKGHMVDDPIAHVRFPKFAATATRKDGAKTIYFVSEESAAAFDKQKS